MAMTEKDKQDQNKRINKLVTRIRSAVNEAIDANELTRVEGYLAVVCIEKEMASKLFIPTKIPPIPRED